MIFELYTRGELKKFLDKELYERKQFCDLREDYYVGNHWLIGGVTTRSGKIVNEKDVLEKIVYETENLIKDSVDTFTNLTANISKETLKEYEGGNNLVEDMARELLTFMRVNLYLFVDSKTEELKVGSYNTRKLVNFYDEAGNITEFIIKREGYWDATIKEPDENGNIIYRTVRFNEDLDIVMVSGTTSIFNNFETTLEDDFIGSLIDIQDSVNTTKTLESNINKNHAFPFYVRTGIKMFDDVSGKKLNPAAFKNMIKSNKLLAFEEQRADFKRVSGEGVTNSFLESSKEKEKLFYKIAKLNAFRNDDLSGLTSGKYLELKMIDTISFVEKIRRRIEKTLKEVFDYINYLDNKNIELVWNDIIPKTIDEKIDEVIKLQSLNLFTEEELKQKLK